MVHKGDETFPKSVARSDNSSHDFSDLPLSILGPRFPWENKPVDPRVLEAIRHKEMGPIPPAATAKNPALLQKVQANTTGAAETRAVMPD
jgi:hypothetical protein